MPNNHKEHKNEIEHPTNSLSLYLRETSETTAKDKQQYQIVSVDKQGE